MKAYIQTDKNGEFYNVNAFVAYEGFRNFGFETEKFMDADEISDRNPEHIIVGGIGNVRKVWESTINTIFKDKNSRNIFIKPKIETKLFAGKVISNEMDFLGLIDQEKDTEIWCSERVDFKTEWRCFIRYKEILDIRRYKSDWDTTLDVKTVENAIERFTSQPNSYALDFGINENNETVLVEVNDGHSLGTYGISPAHYAKFLSARWSELTHTEDYLNF